MKVLIVDDSRTDRNIIRYNLEWHGYQVIQAANGRQGLELAISERPDLIISDCLMPIMDGFQLLYELKKLAELKGIPFIFYSAVYTGDMEAELALSLGAQAFIEKPKSPDEFWEEVELALASEAVGDHPETAKEWRDEDFLRSYSQLVAGKLEEKVRELSEVNERLLRLNGELEQRVLVRTTQLEAANREIEMLCYSISHDLRAPLRHIDGFGQALIDEYAVKLNTTGRQYLDRILSSSRRMLEMIDAILELSRYGRGKVLRESVDLSAMVQEIAAGLKLSHPDRVVTFRVEEGVTVSGDVRLLRLVLENLIGNAWKFSLQEKEALIEFYATEWEGRKAYAVRDNGVGFDMAYADKLFAPFQRLHKAEEFTGKGIGLAWLEESSTDTGERFVQKLHPGRGRRSLSRSSGRF